MTRNSDLIKLIRTYGQQSGSTSTDAADVDIGAVTTAVRSALTGQFLPRSEFDSHRNNRSAHHPEIQDILTGHTVSGSRFNVVGLTLNNQLGLLSSASNVKAAADTLLRSDASGGVTVNRLTASELGGDGTSAYVNLMASASLKTAHYASQTTGWRITYGGEADVRYLYSDEMHVKVFYADLTRALAGIEWIMKSVAVVSDAFVVPTAGSSTVLYVEDHRAMPGVALFDPGDVIGIPYFTQSGGGLTVGFCYGTVSNYVAISGGGEDNGRQRWTFIRSTGSNAGGLGAGTTVKPGAPALDFGVSGNGYIEINAIDGSGGSNAPYMQVVRWTGHPATGKAVAVRLGNLTGLAFTGEQGLYVQGSSSSQYIKATGTGITGQNTTDKAYNGASQTYQRDPDGTLRIGSNIGSASTTALVVLSTAQTYASASYGAGDLLIGNPSAANLHWDYSVGRINFRQGSTTRAYVDTDGTIKAATGRITLADNELTLLASSTASAPIIAFRNASNALLGSVQAQLIGSTYTLVFDGATKVDSQFEVTGDFAATGVTSFTRFGDWTAVTTFGTNWGNIGGSFRTARYRKIGDVVTLCGAIERTSGTATTVLTLPSGHRPTLQEPFDVQIFSTSPGYRTGRVDVRADGVVELIDDGGSSTVDFLWLSGIEFSTL